MTHESSHPDYPVAPPGAVIRQESEQRGMTAVQLAYALGQTLSQTVALLSGDAPIDSRTASRLEDALGVSAAVWIDLERGYRVALAHQGTPADESAGGRTDVTP